MSKQVQHSISKILAEEIKDSRGNPTIKVTVWVGDSFDSFSVPSGASTGIHEAHELRDADGKGVQNAIKQVNNIIAPVLFGQDVFNQKEIDRIMIELDGTPNKDNLGANSMVGVSIACAKVAAKTTGQEVYEYLQTLVEILPRSNRRGKPSRKVPYLFMNLLEGGKHAKNGLAFQEYMIVPKVDNAQEAVDIGIKVQNSLKKIIIEDLGKESVILGDEGGFAPKISDIKKPLIYLTEAIKENNLQDKVCLALDVAASSFYEPARQPSGGSSIYKISGKDVSSLELMKVYESLIAEFNLFSIEDPFDEEDFEDFKKLKDDNEGLFVVGDDLTVSNLILLSRAIKEKSINSMIIKPNQIGTLSETLLTMKLARENNIEIIVSHRSGETDDYFVADLAYAFGCFGLKTGSPLKSERMLKYQRLIEISQ